MLQVKLDGSVYESPLGLNEINDRFFYNEELSMYLNQLDGDLEFIGGGYNYLRGVFNDSICSKVEIEIEDTLTNDTYSGVIFINDIDWDLSKRIAKCKVVSDSYIELIDKNKGIKVQLGVLIDKDRNAYTVGSQVSVTLPNDTDTGSITRVGYTVFDAFDALIKFMSNSELELVSDYFDPTNLQESAYGVIFTGYEIRNGGNEESPLISYQDLFSDINKLHNIAARIEGDKLRIEPKSYFRNNDISATVDNINEVSQELNREMFYASIKMGSAKVAEGYDYLIKLSYNGFQKEQFFLDGQCNIYNELDLELKTLVTDTNIVQDIQPVSNGGTNNSDYDSDIFIVHCDSTYTAVLTQAPLTTTYYYNEYYTNAFISERWSETYPFSIVQLLETVNQLAFARLTADQDLNTNPPFNYFSPDDDSTPPYFDTGNDYQIGSILITPTFTANVGYFEAPSDMVVQFSVDFRLHGTYARTDIIHIDPLGNTETTGITVDINPNVTFNNQFSFFANRRVEGSGTFYMPAGTRLYVKVLSGSDTIIFAGGEIEIFQLGSFGGVYKVINDNNSFISVTNFKRDIPSDTWRDIKNNPFKRMLCTYNGGSFTGIPSDIKRNILTGESDIELYQRKQDVDG